MLHGETICSYCNTIILSSPLRKEEKFFCSNGCWKKFNEEERRLERTCPVCAELIKWEAKKCRHCGEFLPEVQIPQVVRDILELRKTRVERGAASSSVMSVVAIIIFIVCVLAIFYFHFLP